MKICFVQPNTDYQIEKNRHALALTFPQLISDLNIEETTYVVYIHGKTNRSFNSFLSEENPTHVFITAISSTFPYAEDIAKIAKKNNCIVVLGGLFASINYKILSQNFNCFDYIVVGHPNSTLLSYIVEAPLEPKCIVYKTSSNYHKALGDIITDSRFSEYYSEQDTVCYELSNGCIYNCSFCTMRHAFPNQKLYNRTINIVQQDICKLSRMWNKLKLIDDDISLSITTLKKLNLNMFNEVIAETRVDNISEYNMQVFKSVGITHLIVGIESFDINFLKDSRKTPNPETWNNRIQNAIVLCQKYNICIRPVIMITNEYTNINAIKHLGLQLYGWTPQNNIEVLCSFYTPHPGMVTKSQCKRLLTNDLKYFDHLHCVWLPPLIKYHEKNALMEIYNEIVHITKSHEYNPPLDFFFKNKEEYNCFFT